MILPNKNTFVSGTTSIHKSRLTEHTGRHREFHNAAKVNII